MASSSSCSVVTVTSSSANAVGGRKGPAAGSGPGPGACAPGVDVSWTLHLSFAVCADVPRNRGFSGFIIAQREKKCNSVHNFETSAGKSSRERRFSFLKRKKTILQANEIGGGGNFPARPRASFFGPNGKMQTGKEIPRRQNSLQNETRKSRPGIRKRSQSHHRAASAVRLQQRAGASSAPVRGER